MVGVNCPHVGQQARIGVSLPGAHGQTHVRGVGGRDGGRLAGCLGTASASVDPPQVSERLLAAGGWERLGAETFAGASADGYTVQFEDATVDIDLGLTPDAYRAETLGLVHSVR
jgi:hypothetical protein